MSGKKTAWRVWATGATLLLATGCVRESNSQGERVFAYELWLPLTVLLLGVVAVPLGLLLRKITFRLGWGLVVAGPLAAIVMAPSLFLDRVSVSNKGFDVRTGIWGLTAVHSVEFADVKQIRVVAETSTTRRGKKTSYYFVCEKKSGGSDKVPMNNEMTKAAAESILREATAQGIDIRDETGGR